MVQWGPDTVPADRHSGGYDYRDRHIRGFSLTHLSGAGCALYGDFPFLPTTEPIRASPAAAGEAGLSGRFQPGFSHAHEHARPGFYSVRLNPVGGGAIDTALTATTRTGMARFSFPRSPHASVLIDAGGSAKADDLAEVRIDPARREISGSASSGYFCAQRPRYRIYFAAAFDRPFGAYGTWTRQKLGPGSTSAVDRRAPLDRRGQYGPGRRVRQLRHPPQPHRRRPGRGLLRQRRRRPRQPRRREPGRLVRRCRGPRRGRLGPRSVLDRDRRRRGGRRRDLLHGALPRASRAPHLQRRRRSLHRHGRRRAPRRGTQSSTRISRAGTSTARRSRCWRC